MLLHCQRDFNLEDLLEGLDLSFLTLDHMSSAMRYWIIYLTLAVIGNSDLRLGGTLEIGLTGLACNIWY